VRREVDPDEGVQRCACRSLAVFRQATVHRPSDWGEVIVEPSVERVVAEPVRHPAASSPGIDDVFGHGLYVGAVASAGRGPGSALAAFA